MTNCFKCGKVQTAEAIGYCVDCLRTMSDTSKLDVTHSKSRQQFDLPAQPPRDIDGITCQRCANRCQLSPGSYGFCGTRYNQSGKLANNLPSFSALAHMYKDPLPTNCCAGWFCRGNREDGYNFLMQSVSSSVSLKSQRIINISVGSGTAVEIKGWLLKQPKHPIPAAARSNLI